MFSYVDPEVKAELLASGKLVALDDAGIRVDPHAASAVLNIVGPVPLPIVLEHGEATFRWYPFVRRSDLDRIEHVVDEVRANGPRQLFALLSDHMAVNSALVHGDFAAAASPLVRVHSNCLTGDVFGSLRCDCGPQLHAALAAVVAAGSGAVIYMAGHEGRGIGLWAKAVTYLLQDSGHDTYQANERLGLPADSRDFSDAARILRWLRDGHPEIRLLGNNPLKREALEATGLVITAQEPLVVGLSRHNVRYLEAKRAHGHLIPPGPLTPKT
jgi:GTP cyclohydrolase II